MPCQSDLIFLGNLVTVPEWSLGTVYSLTGSKVSESFLFAICIQFFLLLDVCSLTKVNFVELGASHGHLGGEDLADIGQNNKTCLARKEPF